MKNRKKIDTVMLAVALFCISGASLAYNLQTSEGGDASVSLRALMADDIVRPAAITEYAAANLRVTGEEAIAASARTVKPVRTYELLPPIVTRQG